MKYLTIPVKTLLATVTSVLVLFGCHLTDKQTDLNTSNAKVSTRADDCDECSNCCCFVELDGDDAASLLFCGTEDGASACSETSSNCGSISGGGQLITLSVGTPRKLFCMGTHTFFRIQNFSSTDEADFIVSCQAEDGTPQTLSIHLGVYPEKVFISNDGDCEVDDTNCN
ncbi:MAG TPA: hypothetical protein VI603_16750 [Saprospiraceae bacterium]|nr:hypothetical protein [Saprospiraceae bacterium]